MIARPAQGKLDTVFTDSFLSAPHGNHHSELSNMFIDTAAIAKPLVPDMKRFRQTTDDVQHRHAPHNQ